MYIALKCLLNKWINKQASLVIFKLLFIKQSNTVLCVSNTFKSIYQIRINKSLWWQINGIHDLEYWSII